MAARFNVGLGRTVQEFAVWSRLDKAYVQPRDSFTPKEWKKQKTISAVINEWKRRELKIYLIEQEI